MNKEIRKKAITRATELFIKARATDRLIHDIEEGTSLVRIITRDSLWVLRGDTPKRKLYIIICSLVNGTEI